MSSGGVTLICQRCFNEFGTDRVRDLCHSCQLTQQSAWPHTYLTHIGDASGA